MRVSNFLAPFIARSSAIAVVLAFGVSGAHAAGIVGSGSAASCTDAALGAALAGGGSVTFNCGAAPATISVLSTKVISANTTINGENLITLSGGGTVQVFQVDSPAGLTLQNLAITNGRAGVGGGGAIVSTGGIDVVNVSFVANSTTGSGGAIAFDSPIGATLTINGSTFSGNSASGGSFGGGALLIRRGSTATITNSTFFGNSHSVGPGGAIYVDNTRLDLFSVTMAGNTAVGEGGGLYENTDNSSSQNSIFANNTPDNCGTSGYAFTEQSNYNITSDTTCDFTNGVGGTGNLVETNPLLGPLANNGGFTQTMALSAGSPALNAGNPASPGSGGTACPATDQIGTARTQGGRCDIGAFEGIAAASPVTVSVPTLTQWALIGLAGLLGLFGMGVMRRQSGVGQ